jgi:type II secretory pathway component GspD/PulD (secretin)/tetratricopeptide (TPR) repeat protein
MQGTRSVTVLRTLAACTATGLFTGLSVAQTGTSTSASHTPMLTPLSVGTAAAGDAALDTSNAIAKIMGHAQNGRPVVARELLGQMLSSGSSVNLTDDARSLIARNISQLDAKIGRLSRAEVILQRAELRLLQGELLDARRLAAQVRESRGVKSADASRADALLDMIDARRAALSDEMTHTLDDAVAAFNAGDYAKAKSLLTVVARSGASFSAERQATLSEHQQRIMDLELASGRTFGAVAGADSSDVLNLGVLNADPERVDWLVGSSYQPSDGGAEDPIIVARRFDATERLRTANNAFAEGRYNAAVNAYESMLSEFADVLTEAQRQDAQDRIAEAQILARGTDPVSAGGPDDRDALDDTIQVGQLNAQIARAEFGNFISQATASLESGDFRAAGTSVSEARVSLRTYREFLPEAEYEDKINQTDDLLDQIETARENADNAEREAIAAQIADQTQQQTLALQEEKQQKIGEFITQIRSLQADQRYQEALGVVDQILLLQPGHPAALLLKEVFEDTLIYTEYHSLTRAKNLGIARESINNIEALIPPDGIVNYPDDWREISFKRGEALAFTEPVENRRVIAQLDNTRVPANFQSASLDSVLTWVQSVGEVDMDVDWRSLASIGVTPETPIDMRLSGASLETVLDLALAKASPDLSLPAAWAVNSGVLVVSSDEALQRNTSLELYDVRDLIMVTPDADNGPNFSLVDALAESRREGTGVSPFDLDAMSSGSAGDRAISAYAGREEAPIDRLIDLIETNIDPRHWESSGGETGRVQEMNGSLIITTTPKNHRAIQGLLSKLRAVRSMQISVEARFLTVSENFFEQLGFDLDVYFGGNSNAYTLQSLVDPSLQLSDYIGTTGGQLGINQNFSGGGIFPTDTDGDGVPDAFAPITQPYLNNSAIGDEWSVIGAPSNSLGITNSLIGASSFASDILTQGPALGIVGTFLDDIQVDFLIQATQADQRTVSLTAPRITFTNGQRANISVTDTRLFISAVNPIVGVSSVAFNPVQTPLNTGVTLPIQGTISSDRRYVTLNIAGAGISTLTSLQSVGVSATVAGTGGTGGTGLATSQIQQPVTQQSAINTTVTVPDKGTVLLGGQRLVNEVEVESGVPVLSKIPFLSRFFTNRAEATEESTLLILIKPTILIQNEQEQDAFPGLLDELRLGG